MKTCTRCNMLTDNFPVNTRNKDGLGSWCRPCHSAYQREQWRLKGDRRTQEGRRYDELRLNYGLEKEEVNKILLYQDYKCATCKAPFDGLTFDTDHDWSCCNRPRYSCGDCVRGFLCRDCNTGIGKLKEDITILQAAIDYLNKSGLI